MPGGDSFDTSVVATAPRPRSARPGRLRWRDKVAFLQNKQDSSTDGGQRGSAGETLERPHAGNSLPRAASESCATPRRLESGRVAHMRWRDKLHYLQDDAMGTEGKGESGSWGRGSDDCAAPCSHYHPQHIRWRNKVAMLQRDEVAKPPAMTQVDNPLGQPL